MASIAVTTAGKINVVESREQHTMRASVAILAGDLVTPDGTGGLWVKADADGAGTLSDVYGVATRSVAANEPLTAVRRGVLTGWTWGSTAYWTKVLASDTAGEITVTAGESAGAGADIVIGRVIGIDNALIGGSPEKALLLTL